MKQIFLSVVFLGCAVVGFAEQSTTNPATVTCEMRFIEMSRGEVNRLLPNDVFALKPEHLQALDKLIAQKEAVILSQSRIATLSGIQSQVKAVRELIYPGEFEMEDTNNNRGTNASPQTAQDVKAAGLIVGAYKTRETGSILNLTPTVSADRRTISLALTPEVSLLSKLGFIKHQTVSPAGNTEVSQPDFYAMSLSTTFFLKNNSTVAAAVLEPYRDDQTAPNDNVVLCLVSAAIGPVDGMDVPSQSSTNGVVPAVITSELRLVDVPRTEINRLFPNNLSALSEDQLAQLEKLISQKQATIFSQSRLTAPAGQQAQIKAVREYIYPTNGLDYLKKWDTNSTLGDLPGAFKTRELGSIFNLTADVSTDRQTIYVSLTPEVSRLAKQGLIKYTVLSPAGKAESSQPDIYVWSTSTSLVLKNGSTVIVAILDPNHDDPADLRDDAVLILLSAAVNSFK